MGFINTTDQELDGYRKEQALLLAEMDDLVDLMTQLSFNRESINALKRHQQRMDVVLTELETVKIKLLFHEDNNHKRRL